jgi:hypothetical protein
LKTHPKIRNLITAIFLLVFSMIATYNYQRR